MASRVNIRFALILSGSLGAVFALVAGVAVYIHLTSGGRHVRAGDASFAAGEFAAAENSYSRAVAKEKSNIEWLVKWREAMERKIPESETEYRDDYRMYSGGILPTIASLLRTDVEATRDHLENRFQQLRYMMFSREAWEGFIEEAARQLAFYEAAPPSGPAWQALRRYRGIAIVEIMKNTEVVDAKVVEQARADLDAALAAAPGDAMAAGALMEWNVVQDFRAVRAGQPELGAPFRAAAREGIDRFLAANPGHPAGLSRRLTLRLEDSQREIDPRLPDAQRMTQLRAAATRHEPELLELAAALKSSTISDASLLGRFASLCQVIAPDQAQSLALDAIDGQLASHPRDADLLTLRADLLENRRDYTGAIETYQKVIDLPDLPVSLAGITLFERRTSALYMQASLSILLSERATDAAGREAAVARAVAYRDALARRLSARDPMLLLLGAKIAFAQNDRLGAQKLLTEFNAVSASSSARLQVEGLMLAGRVAALLEQYGLAEERFAAVLQRRPNDLMAMASLAEVSWQLNKRERALQLLQAVADSDPTNQALQDRLTELKTAMGLIRSEDPVRQRIIDSRKALMGSSTELPNPEGAIKMLRDALGEFDHDTRLVDALATVLFMQERVDEAIETVEAGLAAHPGDERLTSMLGYLRSTGSLDAMLAMIDASEAAEPDKLVEKSRQYEKFGADRELGRQALRRAIEIDPTHAAAHELLFVDALRESNFAEAERIASEAARLDLDRARGNVYRARILSAQGKKAEAATLLQQAVDAGIANSRLLRLLATIQLDLGRTPAAIQSFNDALARQPDDIETAMAFMAVLAQLEQYQEALDVARAAESFGRGDRRFINQWLDLEARAGNREFAISQREQKLALTPDDMQNALSLATLYTDLRRWSNARALIDQIRARADSLTVAALDARWHADQSDLEAAKEVFVGYIVKQRAELGDEKMTPDAYLTFGQFMVERRDPEVGLAAIDQGRRFQDPMTRTADIFKGDMLFRLARFEDARNVYAELVAAKLPADQDLSLTKRLIEATIRAGNAAEADQIVRSLGDAALSDLGMILLAAEVANALDDKRRALELLERAVAQFPNDPVAYFRRARTIADDPERRADALADLNTALRLRPGFWQAMRARAEIHRAAGDVESWISDLRATLDANPGLDDLRTELLLDLIRRGREGDAVDVAKAAMDKRPSDLLLRSGIGEAFAAGGLYARAIEYFEPVWTDVRDPGVAQRLSNAYLRLTPPALTKAEAVLTDRRLSVEAFPGLLMARARLRALQKRSDEARADASRAFDLVVTDPTSILEWFQQVREVYTDPKEATAFLASVDLSRGPETWTLFFKAETMAEEPELREEALSLLSQALIGAQSPVLRVGILRLQSMVFYETNRFEEAAEAMRQGLAVNPQSPELWNNLAYVLAKELGRAEEALPHARRAAQLSPDSPGILDTLGYVQKQTGDLDGAEETLTRALRMASLPADSALVTIHLGELMVVKSDMRRALDYVQQARQILRGSPDLEARFSKELDELSAKIR